MKGSVTPPNASLLRLVTQTPRVADVFSNIAKLAMYHTYIQTHTQIARRTDGPNYKPSHLLASSSKKNLRHASPNPEVWTSGMLLDHFNNTSSETLNPKPLNPSSETPGEQRTQSAAFQKTAELVGLCKPGSRLMRAPRSFCGFGAIVI